MRRKEWPGKFVKQVVIVAAIWLLSSHLNIHAQIPASRSEALRILKGCSTRPVTLNCSEDTAEYLVNLYNLGDHSLLPPLLDAGLHSDAAMSELLGTFYSDVLVLRPRSFLSSLQSRPRKQQSYLCSMAGYTDGGGLERSQFRKVKNSLHTLSRRKDYLARVAGVCLSEINRANAQR